MLPEISRRCISCGAAVRAGARFCPQCGKVVSEGASAAGDADASSSGRASVEREAESPRASTPPTREFYAPASGEEQSKGRAADVPKPDAAQPARGLESLARELEHKAFGGDGARGGVRETGELPAPSEVESGGAAGQFASAASPQQSASRHSAAPQRQSETPDGAAAEEKRGRVARVREGTRARVENTRARVERVKDDALVALEETPDDSGLRFVAVAAFLFALFLLFLLLSVTVLR
jgi:hypothetical protein